MSQNQQKIHNIHVEVSSNPSQNQQQQHSGEGTSDDVKMMTQADYLKYKQEDSNAHNYYGFSREVDVKPVAWDGKFAPPGPDNVFIVPNRNASNVSNFYGFCSEPDVRPVVWDGTFVKSGETRIKPERNRSNDQKYF
ncbi:hypothetical protein PVAND_007758 [Polypedilum vanderplanki]|uniref:Uncharacterized protein n=1 Tax=Polypedilum vanderplanki TaxID=319348 RepID=A0A9J6C7X8_POLVA|nr:hypothetical protein PVAND_007758 [Polypedilum vanderplanki]